MTAALDRVYLLQLQIQVSLCRFPPVLHFADTRAALKALEEAAAVLYVAIGQHLRLDVDGAHAMHFLNRPTSTAKTPPAAAASDT